MRRLKTLLFLIVIIVSGLSFAQVNYNLPPGESLSQDFIFKDLSNKLDYLNASMNTSGVEKQDFLYFLTQDQLDSLKHNDFPKFEYYMNARSYFDGLSLRLNLIYTVDELWYIYKYDVPLSNLLKNVW